MTNDTMKAASGLDLSVNDFCYVRWEQEDSRCNEWYELGHRVVAACKVRAAIRRDLCIRSGGKPNPSEPPEFDPFKD